MIIFILIYNYSFNIHVNKAEDVVFVFLVVEPLAMRLRTKEYTSKVIFESNVTDKFIDKGEALYLC